MLRFLPAPPLGAVLRHLDTLFQVRASALPQGRDIGIVMLLGSARMAGQDHALALAAGEAEDVLADPLQVSLTA